MKIKHAKLFYLSLILLGIALAQIIIGYYWFKGLNTRDFNFGPILLYIISSLQLLLAGVGMFVSLNRTKGS